MNHSRIFWTTLLAIFLLFFFVPIFPIPVEGGMFLLTVGIGVLIFQLFTQSDFYISKVFIIGGIWLGYLLIRMVTSLPNMPPVYFLVFYRFFILVIFSIFLYTLLQRKGFRTMLEEALIALALFLSLMSLKEIIEWYLKLHVIRGALHYITPPQQAYRLGGMGFGNPNPLAGFLNLVWPLVFVRVYNAQSWKEKVQGLVTLSILGVAFLYTNSRGGLIGAFLGVAVLLMFALPYPKKRDKIKQFVFITSGIIGLFLIGIGILWRSIYTGQFHTRNLSGRTTIWKFSWEAFKEAPIAGHGPGAFPIVYARLARVPPGFLAPSAHNLLLQIAVDHGILGLFFTLLMIGGFLFYGWKVFKKQSQRDGGGLAQETAYLAAGMAFLGHHIVDYLFISSNYVIFASVFLVLVLKYVVSTAEWKLQKRSYLLVMGTLLGGWALSYWFMSQNILVSFAHRNEDARLYHLQEWNTLSQRRCRIAKSHPLNALYVFECANAYAGAGKMSRSDREKMWERALTFQQQGLKKAPYWAIQKANLAMLYWAKGERKKAISLMREAVQATPFSSALVFHLAWMEEQEGDDGSALADYVTALRLNPRLALSESATHSRLLPRATQNLRVWLSRDDLWYDWYQLWRFDRYSKDYEYWKGVIAMALGEDQVALRHLKRALDSDIRRSSWNESMYVDLAYTHQALGNEKVAYSIAHDLVFLWKQGIVSFSPMDATVLANILRKGRDTHSAYEVLLYAYNQMMNKKFYDDYHYFLTYGTPFIGSDFSPLLRQDTDILADRNGDWEWFIQEAERRGETALAEQVALWRENWLGAFR